MRVLLRCTRDAGAGAASLARSVAVGEALLRRGHGALLSADVTEDWARDMVTEAGLDVLPDPAPDRDLRQLVAQQAVDLIHVDGADGADGALDALPRNGIRVSRLDEPIVGVPTADLLVTPSVHPQHRPDSSGPPVPVPVPLVAGGPDYAPLRGAVLQARERRQYRAGGMGDRLRVLVRLGDAESAGRMLPVVQALTQSDLMTDVLAVAPTQSIALLAEAMSTRQVRVLATGRRADLPRLVADHDLVVTRPGPIVWELCCIGAPVALVTLTEADETGAADWVGAEVAVGLGPVPADARLAGPLRALLRDGMRRAQLGTNGLHLVDGAGADRIAALMELVVDGRS